MRPRILRTVCLAALAVGATGACERSPMGGTEVDLAALEALAGPSVAGRTVAADLIAVATRLQSEGGAIPDISLPTLAHLFDRALAAEAEERGPEGALGIRAEHAALLDSAWQQIEDGDDAEGDRLLGRARGLQATTAARVLGTPTCIAYVFLVGRTLQRVNEALVVRERQGADVRRLLRMAASVRDLQSDARSALSRGRADTALDIGAHAADLVNSLIRELASS